MFKYAHPAATEEVILRKCAQSTDHKMFIVHFNLHDLMILLCRVFQTAYFKLHKLKLVKQDDTDIILTTYLL